jgi:hypothetical protein
MFISQTGLTYFYKWPITSKIQILNLIKCGSGICNRCDQRLFLLASRFFRLAKSLWNQGIHMTETMEKLRYVNRDTSIFNLLHTSVPSWNLQVVVFSKNIKRKQFRSVGNNNNVRDEQSHVLYDLRKKLFNCTLS